MAEAHLRGLPSFPEVEIAAFCDVVPAKAARLADQYGAKAFTVDVQPFGALDAKVRRGLEAEAEALGKFLGTRCDVTFTSTS